MYTPVVVRETRPSQKELEHYQRISKIERELQRAKEKLLGDHSQKSSSFGQ